MDPNEANSLRLIKEAAARQSQSRIGGSSSSSSSNSSASILSNYRLGQHLGFYENHIVDTDDNHHSCWEARKVACAVSSSVVSLFSLGLNSSGLVVDFKDYTIIITSAYIVKESQTEVEVLLPNRKKLTGRVFFSDKNHNLALIQADLTDVPTAHLCPDVVLDLNVNVTAVGRNQSFDLRACRGKTNVRRDHFDSDDLMSSSCSISESDVGGPLINNSTGEVIGLNFFSRKGSTPFMPSILMIRWLDHISTHSKLNRPCLGIKVRSLMELKTSELELIYMKFESTNGLFVNEVMKGSPADKANILPGDIIISCNDGPLCSPVQLADLLFRMGMFDYAVKRRAKSVDVLVQSTTDGTKKNKSLMIEYIPHVVNSWPLLPIGAGQVMFPCST